MFLRALFVVALFSPSSVLAYMIDLEPHTRNSPLIATPEAVKLQPYTGAATYTYPIDLPQGTGGLTPDLALTYSSLTKNTEYGWGWTLNIPRIERCTRFGPPTYDDQQDQFELDGELLVRDPINPNRFHKSSHDYSLILYHPDDPGGSYWEVVRSDGTRFLFGSRSSDAISTLYRDPAGTTTPAVFRWYLDKVSDAPGNFYLVDYAPDSFLIGSQTYFRNIYPLRILYSFHPSASHASRLIEFRWDTVNRIDRPTTYRSGFRVQIKWRLEGIVVGFDDNDNGVVSVGEQVRRYELTYAPFAGFFDPKDPAFSQLISIQRFGTTDQPYPWPTEFDYHRHLRSFVGLENWPQEMNGVIRNQVTTGSTSLTLDLDGDSVADRVWIEQQAGNTFWKIARGTFEGLPHFAAGEPWGWDCVPDGNGQYSCTDQASDGIPELTRVGASGDFSYVDADLADMDGDGLPDRIISFDDSSWTFYRNVGEGFAPGVTWANPIGSVVGCDKRQHIFSGKKSQLLVPLVADWETGGDSQLVDVNGDGLPDRIGGCAGTNKAVVALNGARQGFQGFILESEDWDGEFLDTGAHGEKERLYERREQQFLGNDFGFWQRVGTADFNGDGIPDRYSVNRPIDSFEALNCYHLYFGTGSGWQFEGGAGQNASDDRARCAITPNIDPAPYLSSGFSPETRWYMDPVPTIWTLATLVDLNGDGVLDRVWSNDGAIGGIFGLPGHLVVYFGLGDGHFSPIPIFWGDSCVGTLTYPRIENTSGSITTDLIDIDGDGLVDRVWAVDTDHWRACKHRGPPGLLAKVTNELGGTTELEYESAVRFVGNVASWQTLLPDLDPSDPNYVEPPPPSSGEPLRQPIWVVSQITVDDGRSSTAPEQRTIDYAEFGFDSERRRYLGARQTDTTDVAGVTTRGIFHQAQGFEGRRQLEEVLDQTNALYRSTAIDWSPITPKREDGIPIPDAIFAAPLVETHYIFDPPDLQSPQRRVVRRLFDDRFGHLINEVDLGADAQVGGSDDHIVYTAFYPNTDHDNWIIDAPAFISTSVGGQPGGNEFWSYDYQAFNLSPTEGLLTQRSTERFAPQIQSEYQIEYWTYDAFGNPTYHGGPTGEWDATYEPELATFVDKVTNSLGHETRYGFDQRLGEVDRRLDANGYLQCWAYDEFGRLESRGEDPDNPNPLISSECPEDLADFSFPGEGDPDQQYLHTIHHANASPADDVESRQYFDGLGRIYQEERQATSAQDYFITSRSWDARGLLECETLPRRGPPGTPLDCKPPVGTSRPRREFHYDPSSRLEVTSLWAPNEQTEQSTSYALASRVSPNDPTRQLRLVVRDDTVSGAPALQRQIFLDNRGQSVYLSEGGEDETVLRRDGKGRVVLVDAPDVQLEGGGTDENLIAITYDSFDERRRVVRPSSSADLSNGPTWEYDYDANGDLIRTTPPRGPSSSVEFHYDALDRIIFRDVSPFTGPLTYSDGDHRYFYDGGTFGLGRLSQVWSDITKTFTHNLRGDVTQKEVSPFLSVPFTFNYENDRLQRRTQVTFPDGDVVSWEYVGSLLDRIVRPGPPEDVLFDQIQFHANGRLSYVKYSGLTLNTTRTYDDSTHRLSRIVTAGPSSVLQDLIYDIDIAGNVQSIDDGLDMFSQTFTYDAAHRLATATGTEAYAYALISYDYLPDGTGNLASKDGLTLGYGKDGAGANAVTSINYGPTPVATFLYNQDGGVTSISSATLNRGPRGQITSYASGGTLTAYSYDERGSRALKIDQTNWLGRMYVDREYEWHADFLQSSNSHAKHIFVDGLRLLTIERDGVGDSSDPGDPASETRIHHHPDHLGSSVLVTGSSGEVLQRTFLKPFGSLRWAVDGGGNFLWPPSWVTPYVFTGQEYDPESNFYYFGARYYDSLVGRFLSPDPHVIGATAGVSFARAAISPENANPYSYVSNRPTMLVDPFGEFHWLGYAGEALGFLWDAGSYVVNYFVGGIENDLYGVGFGAGANVADIITGSAQTLGGTLNTDPAEMGIGARTIGNALFLRYGYYAGPGHGRSGFVPRTRLDFGSQRHDNSPEYQKLGGKFWLNASTTPADRQLIRDVWGFPGANQPPVQLGPLGPVGQVYRVGLTALFTGKILVQEALGAVSPSFR